MRDARWMPGAELEEDEELENNYGNRMPSVAPMFVCRECGGLNKHLRSCSSWRGELEVPERTEDEE